ncbi:MAG TPA: hypothetical protein VLM40_03980 [Gemmata sp.]|nr:hypothetical protein [Gemmata sp.]
MQPPPKGDPEFSILGPSSGDILGPDFSVYGWGPRSLTSVTAFVGSMNRDASLQLHTEASAMNWEAIYSGVASGNYQVYATCNNNGRYPAPPTTIPVTVDATPGITIDPPIKPGPLGAGGPQTNPWDGWKVTGTYDATKIKKVVIYLTRKGISFWLGGQGQRRNEKEATLNTNDGKWTCDLNFMWEGNRGNGFLAHYVATRKSDDKLVHGSIRSFFNGPA